MAFAAQPCQRVRVALLALLYLQTVAVHLG